MVYFGRQTLLSEIYLAYFGFAVRCSSLQANSASELVCVPLRPSEKISCGDVFSERCSFRQQRYNYDQ